MKRLYIPLPEETARGQIVKRLMNEQGNELSESDVEFICKETDGEIRHFPVNFIYFYFLYFRVFWVWYG